MIAFAPPESEDSVSMPTTSTVLRRSDLPFGRRARPQVEITVNDQPDAFVPSYTTLDRIEGEVRIVPENDTPFDDIVISFKGA